MSILRRFFFRAVPLVSLGFSLASTVSPGVVVLTLTLGSGLAAQRAEAGILFEPLVGYTSLETTGTVNIISNTPPLVEWKSEQKGMLYGGRLGLSSGFLTLGADMRAGTLTSEDADGTSEYDLKVKSVGPFLMLTGPVRLWATYLPTVSTKREDTVAGTYENKGSGYSVGMGLKFASYMSLNVEYTAVKFDESSSDFFSDLDYEAKGLTFGLSLPFEF